MSACRAFFIVSPQSGRLVVALLFKEGGESIDFSEFAPERDAGAAAQTLSQESCQEWYFEHCPPETLVRVQERAAPHSEEKVYSPDKAPPGYRTRIMVGGLSN
jgi:hypothetical protein